MANFFGNSQIYNIHSENEIAEILSHFETEFVRQIILDKLNQKFNFPSTKESTNMIAAMEQNFKHIIDCYVEQQNDIYDVRTKTYFEIIELIKDAYNLEFQKNFNSTTGNYTEVYWMYDFFIGNFLRDLVSFFTKIILKDIDNQFNALPAESKVISAYSAKTYANDHNFGIVIDNLKTVIDNICCYGFTLYDVIQTVYDKNIADIICSTVYDKGDFFKDFYVSVHRSFFGPEIFTDIRLALHAEYMSKHDLANPFGQLN